MINKEEFQAYINSFNKKPGFYTKEEQIKIGLKLKELPVKDRNWASLVKVLGLSCSPNAFDHRVRYYIKNHPDSNPDSCKSETEEEIYRGDYIEEQKVRDWFNAYRRGIREETRIENLKDEIKHAADKFSAKAPLISLTCDRPKINGGKEAVLLFSDLHIGVDCQNYVNTYNFEVAKKRVAELIEKTIEYCKSNNVNILHFINMGDMIEGIIHTNSRIEAQFDVAEQIEQAGELVAETVYELQKAAPELTYSSVFDNHSRAIANKNEHIEKEQFSRLIDWHVKTRLENTNITFRENKIDGGVGDLTLMNGKKCIFAHGHQDGRNNSFQNMVGLTRSWVDYIFLAHYHNPAVKDYQGCKVFINGSIVGSESYAFGRRLFSKASQKLIIFSEDAGNDDIQDIDISLQ